MPNTTSTKKKIGEILITFFGLFIAILIWKQFNK